jgi:vacuolar-type H+-ATPase subunit I/STV1
MSARTVYLSRLLGLYYILTALSMFARKQATVEAVTALLHNAPLMWSLGIITMLAGLATVLAHNIWSRGAAAAVVSFIGWAALFKGVTLLLLPVQMEADLYLSRMQFERLFYMYAAIALLIGVYLASAGFRSHSHS